MILPVALFLAAVGAGLFWERRGLRWLVVLAIVLAPIRGGLLAIAADAGLSNSGLAVNALVPALVAALAIGVLVRVRPRLADLPKPLLVGWGLIALVALIDLPVQSVGLKLYGVGLAQYLVYPTLVIAAWPLYEQGDLRKLTRLVIAMGLVIATTVLLQAAGVEGFIQAASAEVEGLAANRYAGITGSYLHTSAFLGIAAVLIMGELLRLRSLRDRALGAVVLGAVFCGEILTFSRSGIVIAGIGVLALLAFAARHRRVAFVAMVVPAMIAALAVGAIAGVAPEDAGERVSSGLNPTGDPGNALRTEAFGDGLDRFEGNTVAHQAFGEGLGSTGNARKLVSGEIFAVESYYLKLLVETGVFGVIAIGGYLIWALLIFGQTLWRYRQPWISSVAAAGLGLSLYNGIYPALETQILALSWWLLLALVLRQRTAGSGVLEEEQVGAGVDAPGVEKRPSLVVAK